MDSVIRGRNGLLIPVVELGQVLPVMNAKLDALATEQRDEDVDEIVAKGLEEVS